MMNTIIDLPTRRAAKILEFLHSEALQLAVDRAVDRAIRCHIEQREPEGCADYLAYLTATPPTSEIIPFPYKGAEQTKGETP